MSRNIGAMRDRVTILRNGQEVVDSKGNATVPTVRVRTIPAEVRHQSDREYIMSAGTQLSTMIYVYMRTQPDLLATDRLEYSGVAYEIQERHPDGTHGLFERIRAVAVRAERGA